MYMYIQCTCMYYTCIQHTSSTTENNVLYHWLLVDIHMMYMMYMILASKQVHLQSTQTTTDRAATECLSVLHAGIYRPFKGNIFMLNAQAVHSIVSWCTYRDIPLGDFELRTPL